MGVTPPESLDFGALFTGAAHHLNRRRELLWLGLLVTVWGGLAGIGLRPLLGRIDSPQALGDAFPSFDPVTFILILLFLLIAGLLLWLIALVADAALIAAADGGPDRSLSANVRRGLDAVGRLVALDALLFFPLFLLSLGGILIPAVTVVIAAVRNSAGDELTAILVVGLGATAVLLCLGVPVTALTLLLRLLTFRLAVLAGAGPATAVRQAWGILRREWLAILVVAAGMFIIRNIAGFFLAALSLPFFFVEIASLLSPGTASSEIVNLLLRLIVTVVTVGVATLRYSYGATLWTRAVQHWRRAADEPQKV